MKHLKKFNEELFFNKNKVTFYNNKYSRVSFNVDKIENDVVYLSGHSIGDQPETLEITKGGKILNHIRNGHKMLKTYMMDDITLKELRKL